MCALLAIALPGRDAAAQPRQSPIVVFETEKGAIRNPDGQGFPAFGRAGRGMDVVKAIQASPTGQRGPYGTEALEP